MTVTDSSMPTLTSGNGYVSNIKVYGLAKKLAILKKLSGPETVDPQVLLKKYVAHVNDKISKRKEGKKKRNILLFIIF